LGETASEFVSHAIADDNRLKLVLEFDINKANPSNVLSIEPAASKRLPVVPLQDRLALGGEQYV
jgi:hypothetical protein